MTLKTQLWFTSVEYEEIELATNLGSILQPWYAINMPCLVLTQVAVRLVEGTKRKPCSRRDDVCASPHPGS